MTILSNTVPTGTFLSTKDNQSFVKTRNLVFLRYSAKNKTIVKKCNYSLKIRLGLSLQKALVSWRNLMPQPLCIILTLKIPPRMKDNPTPTQAEILRQLLTATKDQLLKVSFYNQNTSAPTVTFSVNPLNVVAYAN